MKFNEKIGFKTSAGIQASIESYMYYPFHLHDTYIEIICVLNGSVDIYDSAVCYKLKENEIHILNAKDPHKIISDIPETLLLIVHIDKEVYADIYPKLKLGYFTTYSRDANGYILSEMKYFRFLLASVYLEDIEKTPSEFKLDALTKEIIELLFDEFHDYAYTLSASGGYNIVRRKYDGRDYDEFYRAYRIADYIETYFKDSITLSEIAKDEFLSVPYLSKYIKDNLGVTFSDLLSIARVSEAERLLSLTNKTIEQIALDVGFANRAHLFQHFSKWFSKSPSAYRKEVLNDLGDNVAIQLGNIDKNIAIDKIHSFL